MGGLAVTRADCRLCSAVVPVELGWLYAAELTDIELFHLCDAHLAALAAWVRGDRA
jgi:hypothetical protein